MEETLDTIGTDILGTPEPGVLEDLVRNIGFPSTPSFSTVISEVGSALNVGADLPFSESLPFTDLLPGGADGSIDFGSVVKSFSGGSVTPFSMLRVSSSPCIGGTGFVHLSNTAYSLICGV